VRSAGLNPPAGCGCFRGWRDLPGLGRRQSTLYVCGTGANSTDQACAKARRIAGGQVEPSREVHRVDRFAGSIEFIRACKVRRANAKH